MDAADDGLGRLSKRARRTGHRLGAALGALGASRSFERTAVDISAVGAWAAQRALQGEQEQELRMRARNVLGEDIDLDELQRVPAGARIDAQAPQVPPPGGAAAALLSDAQQQPLLRLGNTDVAGFLRRQHSAIVEAAADDLESACALQSSEWLAQRASEEWARDKALLADLLGLPAATPLGSPRPPQLQTQPLQWQQEQQQQQQQQGPLFVAEPPAGGDEFAAAMASVVAQLAEAVWAGGAAAPMESLGSEADTAHARLQQAQAQQGQGSMAGSDVECARQWRLLMYVARERERAAAARGEAPRTAPHWQRWAALDGTSAALGRRARDQLDDAEAVRLPDDALLLGAARLDLQAQWAVEALRYLQELYAFTRDSGAAGAGPASLPCVAQLNELAAARPATFGAQLRAAARAHPGPSEAQGHGAYPLLLLLLRRGAFEDAARVAAAHARDLERAAASPDPAQSQGQGQAQAQAQLAEAEVARGVALALEAHERFLTRAQAGGAGADGSGSGVLGSRALMAGSRASAVSAPGSVLGGAVPVSPAMLQAVARCRRRACELEARIARSSGAGAGVCPFQLAVLLLAGGGTAAAQSPLALSPLAPLGALGNLAAHSLVSPLAQHPLRAVVLPLLAAEPPVSAAAPGTTPSASAALALELSWLRLWACATREVVSAAAAVEAASGAAGAGGASASLFGLSQSQSQSHGQAQVASPAPPAVSLLDVGAVAVAEAEEALRAVGDDAGAGGGAYALCERLLLAGQPEFALALLAAHGSGGSPSAGAGAGKGLHDALHMALALAWHGLLRCFPVGLAAQADAEAAGGVGAGAGAGAGAGGALDEAWRAQLRDEAGLELVGGASATSAATRIGRAGFLYARRGAPAGGSGPADDADPPPHAVYVLDLARLAQAYVRRVLVPGALAPALAPAPAEGAGPGGDALQVAFVRACYAALLPHASSRVALTAAHSLRGPAGGPLAEALRQRLALGAEAQAQREHALACGRAAQLAAAEGDGAAAARLLLAASAFLPEDALPAALRAVADALAPAVQGQVLRAAAVAELREVASAAVAAAEAALASRGHRDAAAATRIASGLSLVRSLLSQLPTQ